MLNDGIGEGWALAAAPVQGTTGMMPEEGLLIGVLLGLLVAFLVVVLWVARLLKQAQATDVGAMEVLGREVVFRVRRLAVGFSRRPGRRWFEWASRMEDPWEIRRYLEEAARHGEAEAALALGMVWQRAGQGLGSDALARQWFRRAAEAGNAEAAYHWAEALRWGRGGPQDPKEAHRWYLQSARGGFGPAMAWLAQAYARGEGVDVDPEEAQRWQRRLETSGASKGFQGTGDAGRASDGLEALRNRFQTLCDTVGSRVQAAPGYDRVIQGLAWVAMGLLGLAALGVLWIMTWGFLFMIPGVVALVGIAIVGWSLKRGGWSRGLRALERAAEQGDPEACYRLGSAYLEGTLGLPRDPVTGGAWIRKAAEAGHVPAMRKLSDLLAWGVMGRRDVEASERWRRAAAQAEGEVS